LGALNDNYRGGELIMFEDQIIELAAGDIIVFPSNFLYPHKIEPVTAGVRYSFVSWCF
jgi:predicted 2-oxoglutarate/Fe(II)-dependent dioxygenase YbiX